MLVTTFRICKPEYESTGNTVYGNQRAIYKVPTLPAYAIINSRLEMDNSVYVDVGNIPPKYELLSDTVAVFSHSINSLVGNDSGVLTIYHNGIKDYELLFPHIENKSLRIRLGQFADEASKAFENQSWVSYCLMVGGVVEGLLYNEFGNKRFSGLIKAAKEAKVITDEEASLIDNVRVARNRIHADKHEELIANRRIALEISTAYDRLIKRDWGNDSK